MIVGELMVELGGLLSESVESLIFPHALAGKGAASGATRREVGVVCVFVTIVF
jgi:hypothetical protein